MAPKRKASSGAAAATPPEKRAKCPEETPPKAAPASQEAAEDRAAPAAAFGKAVKSGELELALDSPENCQAGGRGRGRGRGKAKAKATGGTEGRGAAKAKAKAKAKAQADSQPASESQEGRNQEEAPAEEAKAEEAQAEAGANGTGAAKAKAKAKGRPKAKAKAPACADSQPAAESQEGDSQEAAAKAGGPMKPKEIAALIEASTPYAASLRPAAPEKAALKVLSWNVNGIASLLKARPDCLRELIREEQPDVVVLQETKLQAKDVDEVKGRCLPEGWESAWACSAKPLGYSGVATLWRPGLAATAGCGVGLAEADQEGRCITLETPEHFVVGCYVPNAGDGLRRLDFRVKEWEPALAAHLRKLQATKPVVYCGDLNVCHKELDLWGNHTPNSKQAGYTPQERQTMSELLEGCGLVDSFRHRHPNVRAFSYWSIRSNGRAKNNGWRLDYCLVSRALAERTHDAFVLPDVAGSDHCPVGVTLV